MARKTKEPPRMRVWWIPQVPMKPFRVDVPASAAPASASRKVTEFYMVESAKWLLKALADYDQFQLENNIKPDYSNAGGLEILEDGEWVEWHNEDGDDVSDILRMEELAP